MQFTVHSYAVTCMPGSIRPPDRRDELPAFCCRLVVMLLSLERDPQATPEAETNKRRLSRKLNDWIVRYVLLLKPLVKDVVTIDKYRVWCSEPTWAWTGHNGVL